MGGDGCGEVSVKARGQIVQGDAAKSKSDRTGYDQSGSRASRI